MDYRKRIKEYRERIKNKETLKFVDFLDALFDWMDILYENKSLSTEQEEDILPYLPKKIFEELDRISPTELSNEEYAKLKVILEGESLKLINHIIDIGNIKMTDFDLFQFNLYQIFGKEELASMIEGTRLYLEDMILKRYDKEIREQEEKKTREGEWLKKVRFMPEKELIKLVVKTMFDFTPSARTHEERLEAIRNNQERVLAQRAKFRNFEARLMDATIQARADAQSKVYRKIGDVRRDMDLVSNKFRKKAKEFVSEEGPRKKIRKARNMILTNEQRLRKEIKDKGKDWKKDFGAKIKKAQEEILKDKAKLSIAQKQERELIAKKGKSELNGARERITKGTSDFVDDVQIAKGKFAGKAEEVLEKGKSKIDKGREMVLKGKSDFVENVEEARETFSGKGKEIDEARAVFIGKRDIAKDEFFRRGQDIETEMYGKLYEESRRFEKQRDEAQLKFKKRAEEITGSAKGHISGKKGKFLAEVGEAGERFLAKAEKIKGKPSIKLPEGHGKKFIIGAEEAKSRIGQEHKAMMEKAKLNREKMKQEMIHRRELFLYDTRFARQNIKDRAKQFAEKVAAKQEEFGSRGEQIVARHKAHQKAHLIQNLLRTIRSMH